MGFVKVCILAVVITLIYVCFETGITSKDLKTFLTTAIVGAILIANAIIIFML